MNNPEQSSQSEQRIGAESLPQSSFSPHSVKEPACTLVVPGFNERVVRANAQIAPGISRLLSRANRVSTAHAGYEDALLTAIGHQLPSRAELPAAQCSYIADFNETALAGCVRCDPVFLRADRDHARLTPPDALAITSDEADALCRTLNEHFAEDGLQFLVGKKNRWYVVPSQPPYNNSALDAAPMSQAAGRDVALYLPRDKASACWRGLANEVQMLLHAHPVNDTRAAAGQPPVNALWFWGGGALGKPVARMPRRVFTDTAFGVGLSRLSGFTAYPITDSKAVLSAADPGAIGRGLVIVDTRILEHLLIGDEMAAATHAARLCNSTVERVRRLLLKGSIKQLVIDTCDGEALLLSRWDLFRFWVR